ncbi:MAG: hypothetical protein U0165_06035 [Polyangiaceae bacterium]
MTGVRGDLWAARKNGGAWAATLLGLETDNLDTGDVGIGASLYIDGTDWHISYVDGITEPIKYILEVSQVREAGAVGIRRQRQLSRSNDATHHIVGDDSSITVANGAVTVAYQDATSRTLRVATRDASGAWFEVVAQADKTAGFFSIQLARQREGRQLLAQDRAHQDLRRPCRSSLLDRSNQTRAVSSPARVFVCAVPRSASEQARTAHRTATPDST